MPGVSDVINLCINDYAFYWSLPELIGIQNGYYEDEGLNIKIHNVTPKSQVISKSKMYIDLQKNKLSDFYHAAEYVSLSRVIENNNSQIVCWSPWNKNAINGSFGLYVNNNSNISQPEQLRNKKISVESSTGSYYTAVEDLEKYFPVDDLNFLKLGDPHERLLSTINGDASASSLMGIYCEFAQFLGLKKLMESSRRRGTLMISHNDMNAEVIRSFIRATNMSINFINNNPSEIRDFYLEKLQFIIDKFPTDKQKIIIDNQSNISIPKWEFWQKYPEDEFLDLYSWMLERNLIQSGINYNDIVNSSVFL